MQCASCPRSLGRREDVACRRRARYVLRTLDAEVHPSCVHGLKHFFGRSGAALRDAELLERFRNIGDGEPEQLLLTAS
jgi:hypothetical protein